MTGVERFKADSAEPTKGQAPYTFVDAGPKVLPSPTRGLDLSRPVDGAVSGKLTVEWKAETPLLVGGGDANALDLAGEDNAAANPTPFRVDDHFALAGGTIKGLVRTVMESAAFARLSYVDDFAGHTHNYMDPTWIDEVAAEGPMSFNGGWLFRVQDEEHGITYHLVPASRTDPIDYDQLMPLVSSTAADWHEAEMHARHEMLRANGIHGMRRAADFGLDGRDRVQLVVAGQTADVDREDPKAKHTEYLFFWPQAEDADLPATVMIDKDTGNRFLASLNRDSNTHTGPPEANFDAVITTGGATGFFPLREDCRPALKTQLADPATYGLPVFWRNPRVGAGGQEPCSSSPILSMTALFRVPFRNTVHDLIKRTQGGGAGDRYDLVQALLGWAAPVKPTNRVANRTEVERPIRSRVRFGFARSDNAVVESATRTWAATQPKASYWPYYLKARGANASHPVDYNNPAAILAGRKRYPARGGTGELPRAQANADARDSTLTFLKPGAVFTSDIRFRNISQIELGALVWALTFGDLSGGRGYRHMLGRAKSYGYGQVRVRIASHDVKAVRAGADTDLARALTAFEDWVSAEMEQPFDQLPAIRTLRGAAHPATGRALSHLLAFPGKGEQVLKAYGDLKRRAQNKRPVSEVGEIGLPRYPGPQEDET